MTRREQPGEIANTIATALNNLRTSSNGIAHPFRAFVQNGQQRARRKMEAIFRSFEDISISSWEQISDPARSQERILRWAFLPEEFVCTGKELWDFRTDLLEGAIKFAPKRQFIVPNPFHSRTGKTKTGSQPARATAR